MVFNDSVKNDDFVDIKEVCLPPSMRKGHIQYLARSTDWIALNTIYRVLRCYWTRSYVGYPWKWQFIKRQTCAQFYWCILLYVSKYSIRNSQSIRSNCYYNRTMLTNIIAIDYDAIRRTNRNFWLNFVKSFYTHNFHSFIQNHIRDRILQKHNIKLSIEQQMVYFVVK